MKCNQTEGALRELHLFAGAGGGILGGLLLGHVPVCAVELEKYPRAVLLQRQRDGILPWFPVWDDVCTFDGKPWRGRVDIIAGGFPCQDISAAGKGAGLDGGRSGLWREMARIVGEVRPRFVFVENSPMLTSRGLGRVLGDLAVMGYWFSWGVLGADDAGFSHRRKRIWIMAHAQGQGLEERRDEPGMRPVQDRPSQESGRNRLARICMPSAVASWIDGPPESVLLGKDHGMAHRMDRLKAIGNGQVPAVAALAWDILR
jgi:DNA (cytosine-5)-methyltransferase 1